MVRFDHLKLRKTDSGDTGLLVITDYFTKFAEAIPCAHDEYDAQTTAINHPKQMVCQAQHSSPDAIRQGNEHYRGNSPGTHESLAGN